MKATHILVPRDNTDSVVYCSPTFSNDNGVTVVTGGEERRFYPWGSVLYLKDLRPKPARGRVPA